MQAYHRDERTPGQAGVGLAEVLVAVTVLALAMTVALVLYDGARRSFKVGDNLAEQQQGIRVAFDQIARELLVAGFNVNPDGDRSRPDEQIEAAFATALVFRADLDAGDPARAVVPEEALADPSGGFATVSTGNDEIVGYVLAKPQSQVNTDSFSFDADVVPAPRDGDVEPVTVDLVALEHGDPPYTLYRITVDEASAVTSRVPVIDNVRRLEFTYHDESGNALDPAPGGLDDPAGLGVRARASIRRIGVHIEGLTRDKDTRWIDLTDPNPKTREQRKFELSGDITPRNMGLFGLKDLDAVVNPPSPPSRPDLYPGHCGGLWMSWAPNVAQDEVARYEIRYGTDPAALGGPAYATDPEHYLGGLLDGQTYHVTLTAVDDSGNASLPSPSASATTANLNWPDAPQNPTATTEEVGKVVLGWDAVVRNFGAPPVPPGKDPLSPTMRDFARYQVFRDTSQNFTPSPDSLVAEPPGSGFVDSQLVNCRDYYYKVRAIDSCDREGAESAPVHGRSQYFTPPQPPLNVQAYLESAAVRVRWDAVDRDVDDNPVFIEDYTVWRTAFLPMGSNPDASEFAFLALVQGANEYLDDEGGFTFNTGNTFYYRVTAQDACVNESEPSESAWPSCTFQGSVVIQQPGPGQAVGVPTQLVQVLVQGGGGEYTLHLTIRKGTGGIIVATTLSGGSSWSYPWNTLSLPADQYVIEATVEQPDSCAYVTSRQVVKQP